jgi:hypothetical protein
MCRYYYSTGQTGKIPSTRHTGSMISEYMNIWNKLIEESTGSIEDTVFNLRRYSSGKCYTSYPLYHAFVNPVDCL